MSTVTKDNNKETTTADYGSGYLEISEKGFGFLRTAQNHYHPKPSDIFVTPDTIKRSFLREGSQQPGPPPTLAYGQSVTDACMDFETTGAVLDRLAAAVRSRRDFLRRTILAHPLANHRQPGESVVDPFL